MNTDMRIIGERLVAIAKTMQDRDAALARPGTKGARNSILRDLRMALLAYRLFADDQPGYEDLAAKATHAEDFIHKLCPPLHGGRVAQSSALAVTATAHPHLSAPRGFVPRVICGGYDDGDAA